MFFSNAVFSQDRYIVHFTDKDNSPFTLNNPSEYLSQKAIQRRQDQNIEIIEQDIPVNQAYVLQVDALSSSIETYFTSKWLNNLLVQCNDADALQIETLPFVSSVEYVGPGVKLTPEGNGTLREFENLRRRNKRVNSATTDIQNEMLGIDAMHEMGFTGKGIDIAVMDGGYEGANGISYFEHLYTGGNIKYTYDYVSAGYDVYKYSDHGTKVLSLMGGFAPGEFEGTAYDANFYLFVTEDDCNVCEHRIEEYNWVFAAEFADSAGVDIINTSLGYSLFEDPSMNYSIADLNGQTTVISIASTIAASKGIVLVAAAGNEGNNSWGYITAPADAFDILSAANVDLTGKRWKSSSHGNSSDGRIKPDLAAPGTGVAIINKAGNIVGGSGTSFSSPMIAGLVAGIMQAYPELSASEIRFFLTRSASKAALPDSLMGYGIPHFESFVNLLSFAEKESNFTLFPNPIDNLLVIRVNNPDEVTDSELIIYDVKGNLIMETKLSFSWQQLTQTVDISTFRAGVYIINLIVGSEVDKIRIVKI